jgi:hypothetical protein
MIISDYLEEARKRVEAERELLEVYNQSDNIYKTMFKVGLVGIAYLGLRTFIGPDVDFNFGDKAPNLLQVVDSFSVADAIVAGLGGPIGLGVNYLGKTQTNKDLKKAESELETLSRENKVKEAK